MTRLFGAHPAPGNPTTAAPTYEAFASKAKPNFEGD